MNQTDIWMLGVMAFGAVFYGYAKYYGHRGKRSQSGLHNDTPSDV